jgi:hypothetical protein
MMAEIGAVATASRVYSRISSFQRISAEGSYFVRNNIYYHVWWSFLGILLFILLTQGEGGRPSTRSVLDAFTVHPFLTFALTDQLRSGFSAFAQVQFGTKAKDKLG